MKQLIKKYKLIIGVLLIFVFSNVNAQVSLVKDGSFEDTVVGWRTQFGYASLKNWSWYSQSLGGFPISEPLLTLDTPYDFILLNNASFSIGPKTGRNAQAIVTYSDYTNWSPATYVHDWGVNCRTPIRTKLKTKLIAGKEYCATLYAAAYARPNYYTTNGLGMYFDNGQLDTVFTMLKDSSGAYGKYATPQVIAMYQIDDSVHWQKVQGSFIANGTEEYITIANWLSDSATTKIINSIPPIAAPVTEILLEDVSVVPIDITTWLHDTTCALGDSVWVGLHPLDYADGKWYTANMQYLQTGQGFWYKPTQAVTKFIQSIDVCGALKYDTMTVYAYPLSNVQ